MTAAHVLPVPSVATPKANDPNFYAAVALLLALVALSYLSRAAALTPPTAKLVRVIQGALIVLTCILLALSLRAHLRKAPPAAAAKPAGKGLRSPFPKS